MRRMLAIVLGAALTAAGCAKAGSEDAAVRPPADQTSGKASDTTKPPEAELKTAAEQEGFRDFVERVNQYLQLHNRVAAALPTLATEATPQQIDQHQRALAKAIRSERASARRGDIFTPAFEKSVKAVLGRVFGGPDGGRLKSSIMDENPVGAKYQIAVNARYPDQVPLSTVPPQVLASLPKLPKEIEYRFVDDRLILLDVRAHIIVDYIDNALP